MKKAKKTRKKLEAALAQKKLTMYRIAKMIGVDATVAYYWLWGDSVPCIKNVIRLKEILNVSGDEILEMFAEGSDSEE